MIWLAHMKTTVDIADSLLERSKRQARRDGSTLKALIEEGLRDALAKREAKAGFRLHEVVFVPKAGSATSVRLDWEAIREKVYPGHDRD